MYNLFLIVLLYILVIFTSCTKDDNKNVYTAKAIVEGYLVAGQPISLTITKEILCTSSDTVIETIDNLAIKITDNGTSFLLTPQGNGVYVSETTQIICVGHTYTMEFQYNDNNVTASTTIPTKPTSFVSSDSILVITQGIPGGSGGPPPMSMESAITLTWDNPDNDYFLVMVNNIESTLTPLDTGHKGQIRNFRNQPNQISSYNIESRSFVYLGLHDIILYKLNTDYAVLYNENGSNSLNLTKPISIINNGLGIFTGINADTLNIEVTH